VGYVLTQNQLLAPSTQQAKKSWLNTRAGSEACQSIFLKLTKDEKQLDKTWNLPGGTVDGVFWYTKHVHYTLVWIWLELTCH
jgi:hypothetical protein